MENISYSFKMKLFNKFFLSIRYCIILVFLLPLIAYAGTVICRESKISGFDHCYQKAIKVIGQSKTSDVKEAKIYIIWEKKIKHWYIHSNYITPPKEKQYHTTKVATNETNDVVLITQNIIFDFENDPTPNEIISFWEAYENYIEFVVDAPVENFQKLQFGDAQNIKRQISE